MPDLPIVIPDTAAAPKDYTLSGTQELQLKTVRALIDGSGAATAFLPTLQLLDPNGHVMWEGATTSTVAAGGSADVSWFPGLGAVAAAAASGGVVGAYKRRVPTQTFGPVSNHPMLFDAGSLVSNDSSVFSSPDNFTIAFSHGGLVMAGLVGEFGTNGGVPYTGQFEMQTQILDAVNNPVDQLMGPDVNFAELYATDQGDVFFPNGYSIWNCDDSFYTPPYKLTGGITVLVNVTFIGYAMFAAILSPRGLT